MTDKIDPKAQKFYESLKSLGDLQLAETKEKRAEAMKGPVAAASAFRPRDPKTGKRHTRYGVTAASFQKIAFKPMTLGDLKVVGVEHEDKPTNEWPLAAKLRIIANCLVYPDFDWPDQWSDMPDEDLVKWGELNLAWSAVDDILIEIRDKSQPQFFVPEVRSPDGGEKKGHSSHAEPPAESLTNGSTASGIPSSASDVAIS